MIGNHVYGQPYRGFESLPLRNKSAPRRAPPPSAEPRQEGFEPSWPADGPRRTLGCVVEGSHRRPIDGPRRAPSCGQRTLPHEGPEERRPRSGRAPQVISPSPPTIPILLTYLPARYPGSLPTFPVRFTFGATTPSSTVRTLLCLVMRRGRRLRAECLQLLGVAFVRAVRYVADESTCLRAPTGRRECSHAE